MVGLGSGKKFGVCCVIIGVCYSVSDSEDSEFTVIASSVSVYFQGFENGKIISQIVGISEDCDQNGDRVSKNNVSCHICIV